MQIRGFCIGIDKNKRLWIEMCLACILAVSLILIAFKIVYSAGNEKKEEKQVYDIKAILDLKEYQADYQVTKQSNKNRTSYQVHEIYQKEKNYFEFEIQEDFKVKYIIQDQNLTIKSEGQNLEYALSDYIVRKENLLSISTFLELYEACLQGEESLKLEINEKEDRIIYGLVIAQNSEKYAFLEEIGKMELMISIKENKMIQYTIYDRNNQAYIDIIYNNFYFTK